MSRAPKAMTAKRAVTELNRIGGDDAENMHATADSVLLEYLSEHAPEVARAYERVRERAPWWACA